MNDEKMDTQRQPEAGAVRTRRKTQSSGEKSGGGRDRAPEK